MLISLQQVLSMHALIIFLLEHKVASYVATSAPNNVDTLGTHFVLYRE